MIKKTTGDGRGGGGRWAKKDPVLKMPGKTVEKLIWVFIPIGEMLLGSMPDAGTTNPIFIEQQLHEKY